MKNAKLPNFQVATLNICILTKCQVLNEKAHIEVGMTDGSVK